MTFKEFLEGPIKEQIRAIGLGDKGREFAYHAFALDAISIEFIGKIARCKNKEDFIKGGNEQSDFIDTIQNYFPSKYKPFAKLLYDDLRCGMAHFFGPKSGLELLTKSKGKKHNLDILPNGKRLLYFWDFHNDLCNAIDKTISENKPLLNQEFLDNSFEE